MCVSVLVLVLFHPNKRCFMTFVSISFVYYSYGRWSGIDALRDTGGKPVFVIVCLQHELVPFFISKTHCSTIFVAKPLLLSIKRTMCRLITVL